jgi:mRNA interferase HigB
LRIIAIRRLREFWQLPEYRDSEQPLKSWYTLAQNADWDRPQAVKNQLASASVVGDNRVVFNVAGNKYRLIVKFNYPYRVGYVRFVGTHKQYDEIDAEAI